VFKIDRLSIVGLVLAIGGLTFAVVNEKPEQQKTGCFETILVGKSNMGFDIELCHVGGSKVGSKNSILVIGSIHGNEPAGKKVVDELLMLGALDETDVWVIRDANPDGSLRATRQNANGVDLNRNFVTNWLPSEPGTRAFSGYTPASEPETHALMKAIDLVQPKILITIHQPYGLVDCSKGKDEFLDERLAALTGLPATCIPGEKAGSPTNEYTGTISQWVNGRYPLATAIALELGATVEPNDTKRYAKALQQIVKD
jgi:murein peptide amidase A